MPDPDVTVEITINKMIDGVDGYFTVDGLYDLARNKQLVFTKEHIKEAVEQGADTGYLVRLGTMGGYDEYFCTEKQYHCITAAFEKHVGQDSFKTFDFSSVDLIILRHPQDMDITTRRQMLMGSQVFLSAKGSKALIHLLRDDVSIETFTPEQLAAYDLRRRSERDGAVSAIADCIRRLILQHGFDVNDLASINTLSGAIHDTMDRVWVVQGKNPT